MNNLKWLRKQKGITQEELASELGITKRGYQRIEAEEVQIKPKKLKALADYFGVSEGYILGYSTRDRDGIAKLIDKVNHWADERSLKQADPKIQWMRITEEVGEIRDVFLRPNDFEDPEWSLKDAIGDSIVTLIVLCLQLEYDVEECLTIAYNDIKDRKGVMIDDNFIKGTRQPASDSNDTTTSFTGN